MRRRTVGLMALALICVLLLALRERIYLASTLIGTFFLFPLSAPSVIDPSPVALSDLSLLAPSMRDAKAPRIIHQVKLGGLAMRPAWSKARASCERMHSSGRGWEMKLWEDEEADAFVKEHFPSLFETYRGYEQEIQRSNVLRYLVLEVHGGVYLDLDLVCLSPLDPLLSAAGDALLVPPANPTGVNNALIVSPKAHPFWAHLRSNLLRYNKGWFRSPYISNMMSTGCHFFSTMHRLFLPPSGATFQPTSTAGKSSRGLKVLTAAHKLNGHAVTPFVEHLGASSWHRSDARLVLSLGKAVEVLKQHGRALEIAVGSCLSLTVLLLLGLAWSRRSGRARRASFGTHKDVEEGRWSRSSSPLLAAYKDG